MPPHDQPSFQYQPTKTTISPRSSATPLLAEQFNADDTIVDSDSKTGKRRLFGLGGKKKESEAKEISTSDTPTPAANMMPQTQAAIQAMRSTSPQRQSEIRPQPVPVPASPPRHAYSNTIAPSPSHMRSSSPRLNSPASSEIFERNVQEPIPISTLSNELTPAHIPNHVITEDHIPPALEATVEAITSRSLNPDEVEIVTSSSHQPAAATVLESSASHADLASLHLQHQHSVDSEQGSTLHASGFLPTGAAEDEGANNYGALDPNDVRRLSFISFADVVQSEHAQQHAAASSTANLAEAPSRDNLQMSSMPSIMAGDRSGSPLRTPRSPGSVYSQTTAGGVTTPPLPGNPSINTEQSPVRSLGANNQPAQHGELTIQTMRQAVRKTASGDLSGVRSAGMSPVSEMDNTLRESRSRTNT